ncbi:MAG TPA: monovalent cation/H+ antiporter subunit D [Gammaproteobacteria bacterium]|nr:monovalent cation/H+ antiporter subunit D [Gammaproteobacteria bacterium]
MRPVLEHLAVLPIVVPLVAGALMLLLREGRHAARLTIAFASLLVQLGAALVLLLTTSDAVPNVWPEGIAVYAIGGWPPPFDIVLVVDRLSALMLALTATVGLTTILYSTAHWDRPGQPFHPLSQFLLVGLNGAFLTGDLFNLFVFFEILLAASYGLLLRGVGPRRVRKTLHYIAVNLVASYLFLIGVALIYGTLGTLNMADLLGRAAALGPSDRALFHAGAALLGVAFLVKAASWPLNFWLPGSYSAALPPVSAGFALMTKVGIYAVLRIGTLMGEDQAAAAILGPILFYLGLATLAAGTIGMLATQHLRRLVSYSVIVSSGLLLAALGLGNQALTAPVLFYLVTSVLTTAAFFMLTGMTDRTRIAAEQAEVRRPAAALRRRLPPYLGFGVREPRPYETGEEVGVAIPAATAFLGLMFVCCVLLVAGLPPLPSFVAKLALLSRVLGGTAGVAVTTEGWALVAAIIATGFAGLVALTRIGIRLFWTGERRTPRLRVLEAAPLALVVALCLGLGIAAGPAMSFFEQTARLLHEPEIYVRAVLAQPISGLKSSEAEP